MKSTIGKKILIIILVPFLIIFGTLSVYIAHMLSQYIADRTELEIKGITRINAAELEGKMNSVVISVLSTVEILEAIDAQTDGARNQVDKTVRSMFVNESIYNAWLAYEPEAFDGKDSEHTSDYPGAPSGRFLLSYVMEDGEMLTAPDMDEETLDDSKMSPWYAIPRDTNELYIDVDNDNENLYDYGIGGEAVYTLSIVAPISRDGRVIGCVGADVLFDNMTFGIDDAGKAAVSVFYPNGRVFYAEDLAYAEESIDTLGFINTNKIKEAIATDQALFLTDEYSRFLDERAFTYFHPISAAGSDDSSLFLYVALPVSETFSSLLPMLVMIAAITLTVILALVILLLYVLKTISKPIRALTLSANAISQGNLETEIASFAKSTDEIGLLSRSLHRMVEQFRIYIIRLEQTQEEVTIRSQIGDLMDGSSGLTESFNGLSAMICRHFEIYKATIVLVIAGKASIMSSYEADSDLHETGLPVDFLYHSQVMQLLSPDRKFAFLNSFVISSYHISFLGRETLSVCFVPLWEHQDLLGYIILENKDKERAFSVSAESTMIYIAELLAGWVSKKNVKPDDIGEGFRRAEKTESVPVSKFEDFGPKAVAERDIKSESDDFIAAVRKIDGIFVDSALESMGGLEQVYEEIVRLLEKTALSAVQKMDEYLKNDVKAFAVEIHGIKGALYNIGAKTLGDAAQCIEAAANGGDLEHCTESYHDFRKSLLLFLEQLASITKDNNTATREDGDVQALAEALQKTKAAAEVFDIMGALEIISPLSAFSYGGELDEFINEIIGSLEQFDCQKALINITKLGDKLDAAEPSAIFN